MIKLSNCKSIDFTLITTIKHPNRLTIKCFPISDFPVGTSRQQLTLLRMVKYHFEKSGLEQAHDPGKTFQIPDDARTICTSTNSLIIILPHLDGPYSIGNIIDSIPSSVFFH